jgi:hypothetical protein
MGEISKRQEKLLKQLAARKKRAKKIHKMYYKKNKFVSQKHNLWEDD